jgi:hypothetical protein
VVDYAVIENGTFGISVDSASSTGTPMLTLTNTIIRNTTSDGLYAYATRITGYNCVIGSCGGASIEVEKGGIYDFRQVTLANFWSYSVRFKPALVLSNFTTDSLGNPHVQALEAAFYGNSIVYGNEDDEIGLLNDPSAGFFFTFDHSLVKLTEATVQPVSGHFLSCIFNEDPLFTDPATDDFHLDSLSPAIGKGIPMGIQLDIDGNSRSDTPDLGAYNWMPKTQ